jgi:hypothetical protein
MCSRRRWAVATALCRSTLTSLCAPTPTHCFTVGAHPIRSHPIPSDPIPSHHPITGALSHHALITGLDNDRDKSAFVFPNANVGFVYARGPPHHAAHWLLAETTRRFEALLTGELLPLPSTATAPMVVWEQDTFKDVLETAALTPDDPSFRRALTHCAERTVGVAAARASVRALPPGWRLRIERLRFFRRRRTRPPMPSAWLPLHLPSNAHIAFAHAASYTPSHTAAGEYYTPSHAADATTALHATMPPSGTPPSAHAAPPPSTALHTPEACNVGRVLHSARHLRLTASSAQPEDNSSSAESMTANGSFAGLPLWLFSSFLICPHGGSCDGRWARRPPPTLIGHFTGDEIKLWDMRLLGWWHYEAGRLLHHEPQTQHSRSTSGLPPAHAPPPPPTATAAAVPPLMPARASVFPPSEVRPLVLRGHHTLSLNASAESVHVLRLQLVRWALLAIAIGRRAVLRHGSHNALPPALHSVPGGH